MIFSVVSKKSGETFYLHAKIVTLAGNRKQKIYYFSRTIQKDFALTGLPDGFEIIENKRTGLPLARKIRVEK